MSTKTRRKQTSRSHSAHTPPPGAPESPPGAYTAPGVQDAPAQGSNRAILLLAGALALLLTLWLGLLLLAPQLLPSWLRLAATPPPPPAQASPEGRIAFVRQTQEGRRDLYIVNPDGTGQQRADLDLTVEGTIAWSPDGLRILLQAGIGGTSTIVVADVGPDNKVSNAVQLTADVKADSALPSWSPDGSRIAFQSKREGNTYRVFVMNADGSNKQRLSEGGGYAGQPSWSPDGASIAYVQGDKPDAGSPREVYVVPSTGGPPKQLTSLGKSLSRPLWSPDGQSILYVESQGERSSLFHIMNVDGTNTRTLVKEGTNRDPHFSPDGEKIAYWSITIGSDVLVVPSAGGAISKLTEQSTDDYYPAWSPDGAKLTWASIKDGSYRIVVANPDGTDPQVISSGEGSDYQPAWGTPLR